MGAWGGVFSLAPLIVNGRPPQLSRVFSDVGGSATLRCHQPPPGDSHGTSIHLFFFSEHNRLSSELCEGWQGSVDFDSGTIYCGTATIK